MPVTSESCSCSESSPLSCDSDGDIFDKICSQFALIEDAVAPFVLPADDIELEPSKSADMQLWPATPSSCDETLIGCNADVVTYRFDGTDPVVEFDGSAQVEAQVATLAPCGSSEQHQLRYLGDLGGYDQHATHGSLAGLHPGEDITLSIGGEEARCATLHPSMLPRPPENGPDGYDGVCFLCVSPDKDTSTCSEDGGTLCGDFWNLWMFCLRKTPVLFL